MQIFASLFKVYHPLEYFTLQTEHAVQFKFLKFKRKKSFSKTIKKQVL